MRRNDWVFDRPWPREDPKRGPKRRINGCRSIGRQVHMMPALGSITDHTVAGTGPQVGSGSLADIASVVARYILANVTLLIVNHHRVSFSRESYNKPVPKIKLRPNFSAFIMERVKTCCTGSTKSTTSVEICTTEYEIHHGSFLKHLPPRIVLSQKRGIGWH